MLEQWDSIQSLVYLGEFYGRSRIKLNHEMVLRDTPSVISFFPLYFPSSMEFHSRNFPPARGISISPVCLNPSKKLRPVVSEVTRTGCKVQRLLKRRKPGSLAKDHAKKKTPSYEFTFLSTFAVTLCQDRFWMRANFYFSFLHITRDNALEQRYFRPRVHACVSITGNPCKTFWMKIF